MIPRVIMFLGIDIRKNKWNFMFGLVQITLTILLIGYMLQLGVTSIKTISGVSNLQEKGTSYQIDCIAESGQIDEIINTKEGSEKLKTLYRWIEKQTELELVTTDSALSIYIDAGNEKLEKLAEENMYGICALRSLRVSDNFFEFYNLEIAEQEKKSFVEYNGGEPIPVIAGASFQKIYKKNDVFKDSDGELYKIIGFFKKDESYVAPFESKKAISLNNVMVVPRLEETMGEFDYIVYLVSTCFVTEKESIMQGIVDKSNSLNLMPLEYRSLETQLDYDIEDLKNEAITMGCVLLLVFLFAATGMISYMVRFIQNRFYEFAIHTLCGACFFDIVMRILAQMIAILFVADIFVLLIFDNFIVVIGTILFSIIYGFGIMLYPIYVLKKKNIVEVMRRN